MHRSAIGIAKATITDIRKKPKNTGGKDGEEEKGLNNPKNKSSH